MEIPRFSKAQGVVAVLATLACLWGAIALLLYHARSDAVAAATTTGEHMVRVLAESEASSMRAIDLALRYLREAWPRARASLAAAVTRQQEYLKDEGLIQVATVDRDGWSRYSRLPLSTRLNFSDREYFRQQKESGRDDMIISEPVMGRITRQWAIQFSRPLYDARGRFDGIIVAALPPPALQLVYREMRLSEDDVITLVRRDGVILARTRELDRAS